MGVVARLLGFSLMPWQQHVADVALEINPRTGRLVYNELRLTVPRQSGKTKLILAKAVHRASATDFFGPRQQIVYTAQTRKDAYRKFKEDFYGDLEASSVLKTKPNWRGGDEHVRFPNRSRFGIESTTEKAGHGGTLDEVYIDEAFAQVDDRLEQAFRPAMITRKNKQTCIISTAGWLDASPFLEAKVAHGRRLVDEGEQSTVAYFEWSAPQDADPFDRDVWRACMPALGHTIDEDAIEAEIESFEGSAEGLNGFRRAYLNQWVPKGAASIAIPAEAWEACAQAASEIVGIPTLAVSMTPDRSTVTLAASGKRRDGHLHIEIVRHGAMNGQFHDPDGTSRGFVDSVASVARRQGAEVVLHPGHAAGSLLPDLISAGVVVKSITSGDYTQGCGAFYDSVINQTLHYRPPQPELDAAIAKATQKRSGDAWRWGGEHISALVAATQAAQAATTATQGGWMVGIG